MQAPLCFADPGMFRLWLSSGLRSKQDSACGPCTDCTPSFQTRMKRQGRCAHPETMFGLDAEGAVYGYWP